MDAENGEGLRPLNEDPEGPDDPEGADLDPEATVQIPPIDPDGPAADEDASPPCAEGDPGDGGGGPWVLLPEEEGIAGVPQEPEATPYVIVPEAIGGAEVLPVEAEPLPVEAEPVALDELLRTAPWLAEREIPEIEAEEVPAGELPDFFASTAPRQAVELPEETPSMEAPPEPEVDIVTAEAAPVAGEEASAFRLADEDLLEEDWSWEEGPARSGRLARLRRMWPAGAVAAAVIIAVALWPVVRSVLRPSWHADAGKRVAAGPEPIAPIAPVAREGGSGGEEEGAPPESAPAEPVAGSAGAGAQDRDAARLMEAVRRCLVLGLEGPRDG